MTKKTRKLPYREGTWFAVPLQTNGYAVGVVARMDGRGGVFGYFFGPKRQKVPSLAEVIGFSKEDAVWLRQFGDLGFLEKAWPIIGESPNWRREDWPLPPFVRVSDISGKGTMSHYSDELKFMYEGPCDPALASQYPQDALSGYVAVEIHLTRILDPNYK